MNNFIFENKTKVYFGTYTICICYPRANGNRRKFRLKRGRKFAVQSSTGNNLCCCKNTVWTQNRSWVCCPMRCQTRCRF